MGIHLKRRFGRIAIFLLVVAVGLFASAQASLAADNRPSNELREPPVFSSSDGVLDLLMIARAAPASFGDMRTTAWVYEICPRSTAVGDRCPDNSQTASPYGGVRLQLRPGDDLRIRLVNQLPPAPPDAIHALADPAMLGANPTNLHTHGMIVSPHRPTKADPTYGDYVYVLEYPEGKLPAMAMPGMEETAQPIQYHIHIPADHPPGLYWFHPHAHGLSLNQIAHGMGGIITVGSPSDYLQMHDQQIRHLILKDIQIRKDGAVLSQQDSRFCNTFAFPSEPIRDGFCAGTIEMNGTDNSGGKWFFTINGQVFPTATVGDRGDVWRITNASGNVTYLLKLIDDADKRPIPFHVVAIDGASTTVPKGMPIPGEKRTVAPEPAACADSAAYGSDSICTTQLLVMPSARVEVYVPPHFGNTKSATLVQASYGTGPAGDSWPSVKLAKVIFNAAPLKPDHREAAPLLRVTSWKAPAGTPQSAPPQREAADSSCPALPAGHRRRIFFGIPTHALHGLGYEEVDENGQPVPGTFRDIEPFQHGTVTVCLPLAPGNRPVTETWELINVSGEDHNFHIHQTRFRVVTDAGGGDANLYMDSVPVPHGSWGCNGTVRNWRSGACTVKPVVVSVRFTQIGDFVYHCHILSHGDAGMMAHIRVVPPG